MATDYPTSVAQVYRALGDERYWQARLKGSGADEATLERLDVTDDGIDVVTVQVLATHRLPGVVTQFHRGDLVITREETWTPVSGTHATAEVGGSITGAPVSLTGVAELAPAAEDADAQARLEFRGAVEVRVPLVGRKLENFIGNQLINLLIAEQRFTTEWIAENH